MNSLVPLLVWRYLRGARHERTISIMAAVCFGGIVIGSFALCLILCIMQGIEETTHEKLRGIHAHIIMRAHGDLLNDQAISAVLKKEFPQVVATSPTTLKQVILQRVDSDDISNVILLKAIDPIREKNVTTLEHKITTPASGALESLVHDNHLVIGATAAKDFDLHVGDTVDLLYAQDEESAGKKITFQQSTAHISGIFTTGIDEFDAGMAICSFDLINELWPEHGVTQLNLKLAKNNDEIAACTALKNRFRIECYSWQDLYPALVAALKLEKYAMFLISLLIVLIASANILSLEFMQIINKRGDIAILKAMGAPDRVIKQTFILVGVTIAVIASVIGLFLTALVGIFLNHYPIITLPDAYIVSHLPVALDWQLFALVFACVIALSFVATWIPVRRIDTISLATILRSEA